MNTAELTLTEQRFRWDRAAVAASCAYCMLIVALSTGTVLGELRDQFGIGGVITALHGTGFGVGSLLVGMTGHRLVRVTGRRVAMLGALTGIAVGITTFCVGGSWPVTLAGATVAGVSASTLVMLMPGLVADRYGAVWTEAFAATNAVPGVAAVTFSLVIGSAISAGQSWRIAYFAMLVAFGALTVASGRGVTFPADHRDDSNGPRSPLQALRRPALRRAYVWVVIGVLCDFPIGIWSVTYLKEVGGASAGLAPILGGGFGLAMFLVRLRMGRIRWFSGPQATAVSFAGVAASVAALVAAPWLAVQVAALCAAGAFAAPLYPVLVGRLYDAAPDESSATLGAVAVIGSGTAVTFGPLLIGVLADTVGMRGALAMSGVVAVGALIAERRPASVSLAAA